MSTFRAFAAGLTLGLLVLFSPFCRSDDLANTSDQPHAITLGPGDSVSIQIFGQPDATNTRVGDDGAISVPLVGDVQVEGMSPVDAAKRVGKALKDGGYFVDPRVTIVVSQARNQLVSVIGEVQTVGRYPVNPRTTILELLAQAGGVKDSASEVGYVLRSDENGHVSRYPVKLNGLTELKDALPTATLLAGDTLVVPRVENVYITGEVTNPGRYHIEPGMTVIQAIARAGGITERGSEHRIQLKRLTKNGDYQAMSVKPGDPIQADDIIRVKESIF